jgi:hypothetical protein
VKSKLIGAGILVFTKNKQGFTKKIARLTLTAARISDRLLPVERKFAVNSHFLPDRLFENSIRFLCRGALPPIRDAFLGE